MFDVTSITMDNFRSYVGKHVFDFPTAPGLYSLTGQNLSNPRMGSNDCGKSTLLEAAYFCLFGKTTRGVRGGDVVTWGEKTSRVILTLLINDKQLLIERRQAPNSLTLNGKNVTQTELEAQIRLGPDQYSQAIMLPQSVGHSSSFFDLGSAEKLNLFSQILNLDFWLSRSEEASKLAHELLHQKVGDLNTIQKLNGRLAQAVGDLSDLKVRDTDYEHTFVKMNIKRGKHIKILKEILEDLHTRFAELQGLMNKEKDTAKVCSKCKQPLPTKGSVHESQMKRLVRQIAQNDVELALLEKAKAAPPNNVYPDLIKEREASIEELRQKHAKVTSELAAITEDHAAAEFWVSAFKRVRLFVAESAIKDLELEVNGNLSGLGLTDWHIKLDVERETKSGGVTKGFTVLIHAPNRSEPVRWEAFGGGATQRLRLAGNLGLANLIMERAGLTSRIEFYDEVSRGMGATGISDMLETLHDRALSTGRRIFVVDHHALEFGSFAGVLKAVKDEKGSRLEWQ